MRAGIEEVYMSREGYQSYRRQTKKDVTAKRKQLSDSAAGGKGCNQTGVSDTA